MRCGGVRGAVRLATLPVTAALTLAAAPHAAAPSGPVRAEEEAARVAAVHTVQVLARPPYYAPAEVRIRTGDSVRWTSGPQAERHGVREVGRGAFSAEVEPGSEAVVRFEHPGEYRYRCRYHPWMAGTIVVAADALTPRWVPLDRPALSGARLVSGGGGAFAVGSGARPWVAALDPRGAGPPLHLETVVEPRAGAAAGGVLWLATADGAGLLRLDAGRGAVETVHLPGARGPLTALAAGADGAVWGYDAGTRRLFHHRPDGGLRWFDLVVDGEVRALRAGADGRLWLLGGRELATFDPGAGTAQRVEVETGPFAEQLAVDRTGAWILGAEGGRLLHWSPGTPLVGYALPLAARPPRSLAAAADGGAWLLGDGLVRVARGQVLHRPLAAAREATSLAVGAAGDVWLLDPDAGRLAHLTPIQTASFESSRP